TLLRALERLDDLEWTAAFVGRPASGAAAQEWERHAAASPVRGRVEVPGPLVGPELEREWSRTDLLVLPSRVETFGLVVTEAFAHGIPALVGAGTGAVEALVGDGLDPPPGAAADPSDPEALAAALRAFLADPQVRDGWRQHALARRERLRPWSETAREVLAALPVGAMRRVSGPTRLRRPARYRRPHS
ncbi:MAG: glycosyltransferase, partial [Dermatophilaceae bacterium]